MKKVTTLLGLICLVFLAAEGNCQAQLKKIWELPVPGKFTYPPATNFRSDGLGGVVLQFFVDDATRFIWVGATGKVIYQATFANPPLDTGAIDVALVGISVAGGLFIESNRTDYLQVPPYYRETKSLLNVTRDGRQSVVPAVISADYASYESTQTDRVLVDALGIFSYRATLDATNFYTLSIRRLLKVP